MRWFKKKEQPVVKVDPAPQGMKIKGVYAEDSAPTSKGFYLWETPPSPPGVIPEQSKIACDAAMTNNFSFAEVNATLSEGQGFLGYPYLAELAQRPEYRRISETFAKEMTRKWLKIVSTGDSDIEDKVEKIAAIEAEFERLCVQDICRKVVEHDGFFGRGQIYIDTGATDKPEELLSPLPVSSAKIGIAGLKGLIVVEPMWTYPNAYNSTDPLKSDYFMPKEWYVMGKRVHASRLMFCISRKVPDLLKPVYAFGGLSLSQMCKPYVDNWLRTRQSVSDLIHSFSVSGIKTNMNDILNGGANDMLMLRAQLFNMARDNKGLMMIDKDTEEYFNIATPLGSLDSLQAQSQEHMASVANIPLSILLKITPSGLNASSEGEIRIFYDAIESEQEANLSPIVKKIMDIVQLSLFGEIDQDITFRWEPLWSMNEVELANARNVEANTDATYINCGVIAPEEVRTRLASEENSIYAALDITEEAIELPDEEDDLPVLKSTHSQE